MRFYWAGFGLVLLLTATAAVAGSSGTVPVGKGPVIRVGPAQIRVPVASDLDGSWGFVAPTGGPAENVGEWACPGWPPLANGFQSKGPPATVTLPKGGKATVSGAHAVVKDVDGAAFLVARTPFGTVRKIVPGEAAISALTADKGVIRFTSDGAEHLLQPKSPLGAIYAANGTAIPMRLNSVVEPSFILFEHRITKDRVTKVEHLVKCLS